MKKKSEMEHSILTDIYSTSSLQVKCLIDLGLYIIGLKIGEKSCTSRLDGFSKG